MIDPELYPKLARPRCCTARRVDTFDQQAVIQRLLARKGVQANFQIVEQFLPPSSESSFDVCTDGAALYISVLFWESGENIGKQGDAGEPGVGRNCVEVIFCPWGDRIGHLQFGYGPGDETWFRHHWPYRDGRRNLAARPEWDCWNYHENMHADVARVAFFRFPIDAVWGEGHGGPVGFNVMRTQLGGSESAAWSHVSGSGFPDARSFGWLRISPECPAPRPEIRHEAANSSPAVHLHGTYDWPDEMVGGPYTPEVLREEIRYLKDHGLDRLYWIDSFRTRHPVRSDDHRTMAERQVNNLRRTVEAFGGDLMPEACRIAHEEGLEFFTTIKPYDLPARNTRPPAGPDTEHGLMSGALVSDEPFVNEHPELAFRRNPAWTAPHQSAEINEVWLYSDDATPLPFSPRDVTLYTSDGNRDYVALDEATATERIIERPRYRWTPAGKQAAGGTERIRALCFCDLALCTPFLAIGLPEDMTPEGLTNQFYLFAELHGPHGEIQATTTCQSRPGDWRETGFEFHRQVGGSAVWSNASEGIEQRTVLRGGEVLAAAVGHDTHLVGMLEPGFPQVRQFWVDRFVRRAVRAGADGVDVRIAHHHGCGQWLAYAWADPVLEAFRERFDRDPEPRAEDYAATRRIRGEFHTQFLREAKKVLAQAGMRLEHHVEARMTIPPEHDTYTQMGWDCARWIEEGIIDGINLKYIGPFNPWLEREILPRARRRDIPVHLIAAIGDPRSQPRTPEYAADLLRAVRANGLDGLNLYELWVYLRTTPGGEWFRRGCAGAALNRLRTVLGKIASLPPQ